MVGIARMKIKISKKKFCACFPVIFMIVYSFLFGLKFNIFGNSTSIMCLFFVISVFAFFSLSNTGLRIGATNLLAILCMLTILLNRNQRFRNGNFLFDITLVVMYLIYFAINGNELWHKVAMKALLIFGVFYTFSTIYLFIFPNVYVNTVAPLFGGTYMNSMIRKARAGYAVGFSGHYSTTAMYLSATLGVSISFLIRKGLTKNRVAAMIMTVLTIIAILLTGKRAHTLFIIFAILGTYYIMNCEKKLGRVFKILTGFAIVAALYLIFAQFYPPLQNVLRRFIYTAESGDVTLGRLTMISEALLIFKSHPLFGAGWGAFTYANESSVANAHNVFVQLLCDNGVILSIPFYIFFGLNLKRTVTVAKKVVRDSRSYDSRKIILLTFSVYIQLFFLLYCFTGNPLYDIQMLCPYLLACAIGAYLYAQSYDCMIDQF